MNVMDSNIAAAQRRAEQEILLRELDELQQQYGPIAANRSSVGMFHKVMRSTGAPDPHHYSSRNAQREQLTSQKALELNNLAEMVFMKDGLDMSLHHLRGDAIRMQNSNDELANAFGQEKRAKQLRNLQRTGMHPSIKDQHIGQQQVLLEQDRILGQLRKEKAEMEETLFWEERENRVRYVSQMSDKATYGNNLVTENENTPAPKPPWEISAQMHDARRNLREDPHKPEVANRPLFGFLSVDLGRIIGFDVIDAAGAKVLVRVVASGAKTPLVSAVSDPLKGRTLQFKQSLQLAISAESFETDIMFVEFRLETIDKGVFSATVPLDNIGVHGAVKNYQLLSDNIIGSPPQLQARLSLVQPRDQDGKSLAQYGVTQMPAARPRSHLEELPPTQTFLKQQMMLGREEMVAADVRQLGESRPLPQCVFDELQDPQRYEPKEIKPPEKPKADSDSPESSPKPAAKEQAKAKAKTKAKAGGVKLHKIEEEDSKGEPGTSSGGGVRLNRPPDADSGTAPGGGVKPAPGGGVKLNAPSGTEPGANVDAAAEQPKPEDGFEKRGGDADEGFFGGLFGATDDAATAATEQPKPADESLAATEQPKPEDGFEKRGGGSPQPKQRRQAEPLHIPLGDRPLDTIYEELMEAMRSGKLGQLKYQQSILDFAVEATQATETMAPHQITACVALMLDALQRHSDSETIVLFGTDMLISSYNRSEHKLQLGVPIFDTIANAAHILDEDGTPDLHARLLSALAAIISPDCRILPQHIDYVIGQLEKQKGNLQPLMAEHALAVLCTADSQHRLKDQVEHTIRILDKFKFEPRLSTRALLTITSIYESVLLVLQPPDDEKDANEVLDILFDGFLADAGDPPKRRPKAYPAKGRPGGAPGIYSMGVPRYGEDVRLAAAISDLYPSNRKVAGAALRALSVMCRLSNTHAKAVANDGLRVMSHAQRRFKDSHSAALHICQGISEIARREPKLLNAGALTLVAQALRTFPKDVTVLIPGCLALQCLRDHMVTVVRDHVGMKLLDDLVSIGDAYSKDYRISVPILHVISVLGRCHKASRERLVQAGAVGVPMRALHTGAHAGQASAAGIAAASGCALKVLVFRSQKALDDVPRCGGMPVLFGALAEHRRNRFAVHELLAAIGNSAEALPLEGKVFEAVAKLFIEVMEANAKSEADLVAQGCRAFGALALEKESMAEGNPEPTLARIDEFEKQKLNSIVAKAVQGVTEEAEAFGFGLDNLFGAAAAAVGEGGPKPEQEFEELCLKLIHRQVAHEQWLGRLLARNTLELIALSPDEAEVVIQAASAFDAQHMQDEPAEEPEEDEPEEQPPPAAKLAEPYLGPPVGRLRPSQRPHYELPPEEEEKPVHEDETMLGSAAGAAGEMLGAVTSLGGLLG